MSPAVQPSDHPASQPDAPTQSEARPVQILREGGGNLEKIRDILFGTQVRGYEARFAALEEALAKETAEIRETSRRRFEQLESYIKKELELLQTRWKAERDERSDAAVQHSRELRELGESLSRRVRDLELIVQTERHLIEKRGERRPVGLVLPQLLKALFQQRADRFVPRLNIVTEVFGLLQQLAAQIALDGSAALIQIPHTPAQRFTQFPQFPRMLHGRVRALVALRFPARL